MKNFQKFTPNALTRAELKEIKGSQALDACSNAWTACDPSCGHFTTAYETFVTCINNYHITGCSPLEGWGVVCGNYN
jgi:hypothetical protein